MMAQIAARTAPIIGNRYAFHAPDITTPNRPTNAPRQTPGKISGNNTPSAIPTIAESTTKIYINTMAISDRTGTNNGSKKVYVTNPATPANIKPEYNLRLLLNHNAENIR